MLRSILRTLLTAALFLLLFTAHATDGNVPGSALLPVPRKVNISNQMHLFDKTWSITYSGKIATGDAAVTSLVEEINNRFDIELNKNGTTSNHSIKLEIKPGAITVTSATDTNRTNLAKQAYRLKLNPDNITVTANASAGLFYGVQTLLQLFSSTGGQVMFPEGTVEDWPNLEMRIIYWDDAHHLEKIKALKRAIRQAAHYKINGFAIKLEGHFQYKIAKPITEPYAYTAAEYQELTDYAARYHVQLIPFLDCPAHVSFILKHPEYASLRAYPDNNYEFSVVNRKVDELVVGMFNELFDANKGSKYVFLSTDEAYYIGKPENEKAAANAAGGNGALLAQFITRIAHEIHKRGRTPIIWGEYPLTKNDIPSLPSFIVNGVYDSSVAALYKEQGIRQMIYTSTQGVEPLFPEYYNYPAHKFERTDTTESKLLTDDEMMQGELGEGRVQGLLSTITSAIAEKRANFIGSIVAGWGDSGLNPETFWLGYCTGSAAGWNHEKMSSANLSDRFFASFYHTNADKIEKIYKLMSSQSQFWEDSWEWAPLKLRTPIVGNSEGIFDQPRHLKDQTLSSLPSFSDNGLTADKDWNAANAQRLRAVEKYLSENTALVQLLQEAIQTNNGQQYHLRVFMSVAGLCRQNLQMLLHLRKINELLADAGKFNGPAAVVMIDQALDVAKRMRDERNDVLHSLETTWYEEWFPRVLEANGRKFLDVVDDVKDHVPIRTVDMSYVVYRQLNYPMDKWWSSMLSARNNIAAKSNLPVRTEELNWQKLQ